jgi:hypothetical protein
VSKKAGRPKPDSERSDVEREPDEQPPRTAEDDEFDPDSYDEKRRRELERYKEVRPKG